MECNHQPWCQPTNVWLGKHTDHVSRLKIITIIIELVALWCDFQVSIIKIIIQWTMWLPSGVIYSEISSNTEQLKKISTTGNGQSLAPRSSRQDHTEWGSLKTCLPVLYVWWPEQASEAEVSGVINKTSGPCGSHRESCIKFPPTAGKIFDLKHAPCDIAEKSPYSCIK